MQLMSKHMFKIRDTSRNKVIGHIQLTHFITKEILSSNNLPPFHMFALQYLSQVHHEVLFRDRIQYPKMWRPHGIQVRDTAVHSNGGPQLSQQQQIIHSNNKLITTTTKIHIKIEYPQNKRILSQNHEVEAVYFASFWIWRKRESPDLVGEDLCRSSWLHDEGTRYFLEGEIEWILDAFNKVFIRGFNPSFYLTKTRLHVGNYKAIQHTLVTLCNKSPWMGESWPNEHLALEFLTNNDTMWCHFFQNSKF